MDEFLKLFGHMTVVDVVGWIVAIGFVWKIYQNVRDYLIDRHEAEVQRDNDLQEALQVTRKYPEYRAQSIEIQQKLEQQITNINDRLKSIEDTSKKRERNKLRECILRSYRYYTSPDKNPQQAWTRMEEQTFWASFGDYEEADGDGYVHTVVQPAMNKLSVIEMNDEEAIENLMKSRR